MQFHRGHGRPPATRKWQLKCDLFLWAARCWISSASMGLFSLGGTGLSASSSISLQRARHGEPESSAGGAVPGSSGAKCDTRNTRRREDRRESRWRGLWWVSGGHPHHSSAGFGAASQGVAKKKELAVALRLHPTLSPRLFLEESQQTVSCGLCGWPISIMTEIRLCHNCSLSQSGGAMMTSCSTSQTVQTNIGGCIVNLD